MRHAVFVLAGMAATLTARSFGSIDEFIAAEMPRSGAPGVAYAIVNHGEVTAGARGEVRIGSGRPVTPDTPFLLGSITKSFTAMAVMKLVEAGTVYLDAGISQYLEVFADHPSGTITIRQLLSHTSGYSTAQGNATHTGLSERNDELARWVEQIAQWTPTHKPGTRWEYSNANYQILGALIERASGRSYADYIVSEILEPIGMNDSFVADGERHDIMATGHRPWFGTKRPMVAHNTQRVTAPAGGVIASARDVAKYMAVMMNGVDDVISAESKAAMMRPASAVSPFYGFGWFIDENQGTVSHTGSSPGIETLATMIPSTQQAVVVLVNAGSGIGFGETLPLREGLAAAALGLEYAGEGSRWQQKATFAGLALLPPVFVLSMLWAWFHRDALRAKSGAFGMFSLWFPVLTTLAMAWMFFWLIPRLFGVSMGTLRLFQPDLALTMRVAAATGVMWAVFRLGVAYAGRSVAR